MPKQDASSSACASGWVLLFVVICLGPYFLMRVGKMSSQELPVPDTMRRKSVKKVRVLRGTTDLKHFS